MMTFEAKSNLSIENKTPRIQMIGNMKFIHIRRGFTLQPTYCIICGGSIRDFWKENIALK